MGKDLKGKELGKGISQRLDGRYNARATINGININIYNTKLSQLKKDFDLKKAEVLKKEFNVRKGITLNEWFDEWFEIYKAPRLKDELNRHNYARRYRNTFGKHLGMKQVEFITEKNIQQAANELISIDKYSSKMIKESISSLKECLTAAVSNRIININPCLSVDVDVSNDKVKDIVVLSEEEQKKFLEVAENRYYYEAYQILLSTGMRIGEFSALRWKDVDFKNKVIHIKHSMQSAYDQGNKILNITTPKTVNSIRDIPMFEGVESFFLSWKKKQEDCKKKMGDRWRLSSEYEDLVFTSTLGSPVTRYVLSNDIKKILEIIDKNEQYMAQIEKREPLDFPKVHPHAFRHTFATRCFEKNLEPLFIMRIMGHSNYQTTMRYTHILQKTTDKEVKKAGSFVSINKLRKPQKKKQIKKVSICLKSA